MCGDTCLFADGWRQAATSSVLVAASRARARAAHVPAFLRDFCVTGDRLLFRTLGDRFTIRSLSIGPLLH